MTTRIRRATESDLSALILVGTATFLETYTEILPGPDVVSHCKVHHAREKYAAWLADPDCAVWIAEARLGAPIGYLVLTPATLPLEGPVPGDLEVLRIYVLAPYHKDGLGLSPDAKGDRGGTGAWGRRLVLGMHNDNVRAMAFYRRQGFEVIAARNSSSATRCVRIPCSRWRCRRALPQGSDGEILPSTRCRPACWPMVTVATVPESDSYRQVEALSGPCRSPPNPPSCIRGLHNRFV